MNNLKAVILLALSVYLALTIWSGRLYYYIGPRFAWMAVLSVALLLLPAAAYLLSHRQHNHDHDHDHGSTSVWTVALVALPLLLGLLVPPRPLGASSIANRGFANDTAASSESLVEIAAIEPERRNVLDWVRAIHANRDPHALDGQPVDVIGFVYSDAQFGADQFMVARLAVVCCVADASAIGLVVQSSQAAQLTPDTWVRVKGKFAAGVLDDRPTPVVIAAEIIPVEPPAQPYLYP